MNQVLFLHYVNGRPGIRVDFILTRTMYQKVTYPPKLFKTGLKNMAKELKASARSPNIWDL